MKIWTVTPNDDNGLPAPAIYFTKEEADIAAAAWVAENWLRWFGTSGATCPSEWERAHEILSEQAGFLDSISVAEHDISGHPDLQPDPYQTGPEATAYRKAAQDAAREGECEVDDGAIVSKGEDAGAYVAAWVWVDDEDAGLDPTCRTCGERYSDGGDGYDGECPDCADKTEAKRTCPDCGRDYDDDQTECAADDCPGKDDK